MPYRCSMLLLFGLLVSFDAQKQKNIEGDFEEVGGAKTKIRSVEE